MLQQYPVYSLLVTVLLFVNVVTALFGPLLFSVLELYEHSKQFTEFFRVRLFDILFQLEQLMQQA